MSLFSRRHRISSSEVSIEISEKAGVRALHLGSATVQSAMRIADPVALELPYTRSIMAYLLFVPEARQILMVGLGGGSIPKFVHHHQPNCRVVSVEINPQIVAAAHSHFALPADDETLTTVVGDGANYVAQHEAAFDVIITDGFTQVAHAEELTTEMYYCDCLRALSKHGVFVMNLWGSNPRFPEHLQRIESVFNGLTLCLPAEKHGNVIVFGFKHSPGNPRWDDLRERARLLELRYPLEFRRFVEGLKPMNLHSDKRLLV